MPVNFFNEGIDFSLENPLKIINWIDTVIKDKGFVQGTINYIFCSDEYLLGINQEYLDHDTYTDIITFDYSKSKVVSGDIFVSIDRIEENASTYHTSFQDELMRVIIHGILHLTGLKDKTDKEIKEMRKNEDHYLSLL